jgi:hypothetical protein
MNFILVLILFILLILLVAKNPMIAWSLPYLGVMFGLPIALFIPNSNYFIYSLQLSGICASARLFAISPNSEIKKRIWNAILLLSFISILGLLIGLGEVSPIVAFQGVKLLLLPILLSIGAINSEIRWDKIFKVLVSLMFLQVLMAITEYVIGITKLLDLGLVYGTQVRQIEGQLRAPALFSTHFEFGLFSAALFCASVYLKELSTNLKIAWIRLGAFCGILGVLLSTTRTAVLIVVFVFIARKIETTDIARKLFSLYLKTLILTVGSLLFLYFLPSVFTPDSIFSRFENWKIILNSFNILFGKGAGIAGGATSSNFAVASQRVVVDNYILSLLVQFGLAGLFLFLLAIKNLSLQPPKRSPLLLSILISFFTLETWEYYASISLILIIQVRLLNRHGISRK